MACRHFPAKIQHGRLHIRHAGQIPGFYRLEQIIIQFLIPALQVMMPCRRIIFYLIHPGPVLGRLKSVGLKIDIIIFKIKRIRIQHFSLFAQFPAADRRHQAAVHAARQKSADRYIRQHLYSYRILQKILHLFHRILPRVLMNPAFQLPITMLPAAFRPAFQKMPRQYFIDSPEHPFSICFCGAKP